MSSHPGLIRATAAALGVIALMLATPARAPHEPGHRLRLVVPQPAGTFSDAAARSIAGKASENLGVPVEVETRPGGGGAAGVAEVKRSGTDGAALLVIPVDLLVFVRAPSGQDLDQVRDFEPVTQVGTYDYGIAVPAEAPVRALADLLAQAKASPGKVTYAVFAAASLPNLIGVTLARVAGVELPAVPLGATPAAVGATLNGQVSAVIAPLAVLAPLHAEKRLRILAKTGRERSSRLPDVPSLRELGFALEATGWLGVVAPAGTPRKMVERLSKAVAGAIQAPEVRERLERIGLQPTGTSPDDFGRVLRSDLALWTSAARTRAPQ